MARSEQGPKPISKKRAWVVPPEGLKIVNEVWHDRETRLKPASLTPEELNTLKQPTPQLEGKTLFEGTSADGE